MQLPRLFFKKTAGVLLVISGITHVMQLWVYGAEGHVLGAVAFGVIYFVLGVWLLKDILNLNLTLAAAIIPLIGGVLGLGRLYLFYLKESGEMNWFIIWHVLVDLYVVPVNFICYFRSKRILREKQRGFPSKED